MPLKSNLQVLLPTRNILRFWRGDGGGSKKFIGGADSSCKKPAQIPCGLAAGSGLLRLSLIVFALGILFVFQSPVEAINPSGPASEAFNQLEAAGGSFGQDSPPTDPRYIVAFIIRVVLSLLGTIFLVLAVYAGYLWMTAAGDSKQVDRAKQLLKDAVLGLVVILSAYSITLFAVKIATQTPDDGVPTFFDWSS